MHFQETLDKLRAHPVRYITTVLAPGFLQELASHAFYSTILEYLREHSNPFSEAIKELFTYTIEHPIASFLSTFGVVAALLLSLIYIEILIAHLHSSKQALKAAAVASEDRLKEIERRLELAESAALAKRCADLERVMMRTLDGLPRFRRVFGEVDGLILQADTALLTLFRIKACLPQDHPAKQPFSQNWIHSSGVPKEPMVLEWQILIERHVWLCTEFAGANSFLLSSVLLEDLQNNVANWNSHDDLDSCIALVRAQRAKLMGFSMTYAPSFVSQLKQS